MTFSNGQFNPHPLANPFNTRIGPANYSLNSYSDQCLRAGFNSKTKELPRPIMLGENPRNDCSVPNSSMPLRLADIQAILNTYSANQTWNNNEIYSLSQQSVQKLTKQDIEYWNKAKEESEKMLNNLSQKQKEMLAELSNMFPASKLEDVDD